MLLAFHCTCTTCIKHVHNMRRCTHIPRYHTNTYSNRLAPALGTSPVLALEFAVLPLAVALFFLASVAAVEPVRTGNVVQSSFDIANPCSHKRVSKSEGLRKQRAYLAIWSVSHLHLRVCDEAGHPLPPLAAFVLTVRLRIAVPEHLCPFALNPAPVQPALFHAAQLFIAQLTLQPCVLHFWLSESFGHAVPADH